MFLRKNDYTAIQIRSFGIKVYFHLAETPADTSELGLITETIEAQRRLRPEERAKRRANEFTPQASKFK